MSDISLVCISNDVEYKFLQFGSLLIIYTITGLYHVTLLGAEYIF